MNRPMIRGDGTFEPYRPWTPERRARASEAAKKRLAAKMKDQNMGPDPKPKIVDDGIREICGIECSAGAEKRSAIVLREHGTHWIQLDEANYVVRFLNEGQARYLAMQLNRFADRIDGRKGKIVGGTHAE